MIDFFNKRHLRLRLLYLFTKSITFILVFFVISFIVFGYILFFTKAPYEIKVKGIIRSESNVVMVAPFAGTIIDFDFLTQSLWIKETPGNKIRLIPLNFDGPFSLNTFPSVDLVFQRGDTLVQGNSLNDISIVSYIPAKAKRFIGINSPVKIEIQGTKDISFSGEFSQISNFIEDTKIKIKIKPDRFFNIRVADDPRFYPGSEVDITITCKKIPLFYTIFR